MTRPGWWDWRVSAHCRIASLGSAWVLVLGAALLGPFLWPLAAVRFVASTAQTVLNIQLGRRRPVGAATRLDKWLVAAIFAGAYAAAGVGRVTGDMTAPYLCLPMLLPFSLLQLRMTSRSLAAQPAQDGPAIVQFPDNETAQAVAA